MNVLNTLWDSYYYILTSRKEYEIDTLMLIRAAIEAITLTNIVIAANKY